MNIADKELKELIQQNLKLKELLREILKDYGSTNLFHELLEQIQEVIGEKDNN